LTNATALLTTLLGGTGILAATGGLLTWGIGRATDSPRTAGWGKNSILASIGLFSGSAVIGIAQNVSTRLFS